jgi:hypothetical protein
VNHVDWNDRYMSHFCVLNLYDNIHIGHIYLHALLYSRIANVNVTVNFIFLEVSYSSNSLRRHANYFSVDRSRLGLDTLTLVSQEVELTAVLDD